jgi:tRNA nucleotidyltransferase/poly(A) polymerase
MDATQEWETQFLDACNAVKPQPKGGHSAEDIKLDLSEIEERIFKLICDVCHHYGIEYTNPRVAGGWVRDKILKKESDDIDIALENMEGEQFAQKVHEYLTVVCGSATDIGSISVIKSNPEQSKHLNTAKFRVYGQEIDMSNFRTEHYSNDSRIPLTVAGSVREDVCRRDFTVNAMYYNLLEQKYVFLFI